MERPADFKLVLDTNVLVRGLANRRSASGRLLRLCERRAILLLLSRPIMLEYRQVLTREEVTLKNPAITTEAVGLVIERLHYFAQVIDPVRVRFSYDRDPADECFIELAISGNASHVITHDQDLLCLPTEHTDAGRRLRQRRPGLRILRPEEFMGLFEDAVQEQASPGGQ